MSHQSILFLDTINCIHYFGSTAGVNYPVLFQVYGRICQFIALSPIFMLLTTVHVIILFHSSEHLPRRATFSLFKNFRMSITIVDGRTVIRRRCLATTFFFWFFRYRALLLALFLVQSLLLLCPKYMYILFKTNIFLCYKNISTTSCRNARNSPFSFYKNKHKQKMSKPSGSFSAYVFRQMHSSSNSASKLS